MGKVKDVEKAKESTTDRIIIEKGDKCGLIRSGSEENGHDCWGNYEYSHYNYVWINGKEERIYQPSKHYIIHNGRDVLETGYLSSLDNKLKIYLDKDFYESEQKRLKEERYLRYLKLKKEFDNDPIYSRDSKLEKIINEV